MKTIRGISVKSLTRVEGEGSLRVRLVDGRVEIAEFKIYEPPRFFERLLRGRQFTEVPDITARICGICPVAYQMSSCIALEKALGIDVGPAINRLRRLLYCGEWITSHALHMHLLHAPDFLGCESAFSLPPEYASFLEDGLFLKGLGNRILEAVGGRAVHPINVAVGGFHRGPDVAAIRGLLPDLERGLEAARRSLDVIRRFEFPAAPSPHHRLSLVSDHEYPMNHGDLAISGGSQPVRVPIEDFPRHSREFQVRQSTALHSRLIDGDAPYLCGPLARLSHNLDRFPEQARQVAESCGIDWTTASMPQSIVARGIEVLAAIEEALTVAHDYQAPPTPARLVGSPRAGSGSHATEAPRGLLFHHYEIDAAGLVTAATIIPPTSQKQAQVESDLAAILGRELARPEPADDASLTRQCETLIRSYDPCISCATHFLTLSIDR